MTERENGDGRDYPDGSVGRYVRERWGDAPVPKATRPYAPPVVQPDHESAEPLGLVGEAAGDVAGNGHGTPDAARGRRGRDPAAGSPMAGNGRAEATTSGAA